MFDLLIDNKQCVRNYRLLLHLSTSLLHVRLSKRKMWNELSELTLSVLVLRLS